MPTTVHLKSLKYSRSKVLTLTVVLACSRHMYGKMSMRHTQKSTLIYPAYPTNWLNHKIIDTYHLKLDRLPDTLLYILDAWKD